VESNARGGERKKTRVDFELAFKAGTEHRLESKAHYNELQKTANARRYAEPFLDIYFLSFALLRSRRMSVLKLRMNLKGVVMKTAAKKTVNDT